MHPYYVHISMKAQASLHIYTVCSEPLLVNHAISTKTSCPGSFISSNPLYTYGLFQLVWYNKLRIVHCTYLGVYGYNFQKNIAFLCLKTFFTFTNSVDPDEMQQHAAFHLDLHCLQRYVFRGFPKFKGRELISGAFGLNARLFVPLFRLKFIHSFPKPVDKGLLLLLQCIF